MPRKKPPPEAEKLRRRALARWENEGGADPCGPQVPGMAKACGEEGAVAGEKDATQISRPRNSPEFILAYPGVAILTLDRFLSI